MVVPWVLWGSAVVHERGSPVGSYAPFVQGYLAHKKQLLPRTLHEEYAEGPMVVLWVLWGSYGGVSHERGTPVGAYAPTAQGCLVHKKQVLPRTLH